MRPLVQDNLNTHEGHDSVAGRAWAEASQGVLRQQGGSALVELLRSLTLPREVREEGRECYRLNLGYFEGKGHRLD